MKIKIYKSLAMCTLLLGLAACNDFEEMNTDPYAPVYDPEIIGATPDGIVYPPYDGGSYLRTLNSF